MAPSRELTLNEALRDLELQEQIPQALAKLYNSLLHMLDPGESNPPVVRRDGETGTIDEFVKQALSGKPSSCMLYISGVPGTGKTTVVRSVVSKYSNSDSYDFELCELNGMELVQPMQTFIYIWRSMQECLNQSLRRRLEEADTPNSAETALDNLRQCLELQQAYEQQKGKSSTPPPLERTLLVVLDEMDIAIGNVGSTVLFDLTDLLLRTKRFCFIGIANRQNLFETFRFDEGHTLKIQSRTEKLRRLIFPNYSGADLHEILLARVRRVESTASNRLQNKTLRLKGTDVLQDNFLRFASVSAHKLAGGDCRSALHLIMHIVNEKLKYVEAKLVHDRQQARLGQADLQEYMLGTRDVQASKVQTLGRSQRHPLSDLELLCMGLIGYEASRRDGDSSGRLVRIEAVSQRYQLARPRLASKGFDEMLQTPAAGEQLEAFQLSYLASGSRHVAELESDSEGEEAEGAGIAAHGCGGQAPTGTAVGLRDATPFDLVQECSSVLASLSRLGYVTLQGPHVSLEKLTSAHTLGPVLAAHPSLLQLPFIKDLPLETDLLA